MSPDGDDNAPSASSEDKNESSSRVRPLSFQSWARSRNDSSSTPRPLSLQPQAHLREERPSGPRPLSVLSRAGVGDELSSRARPLSIPSWGDYRAKRRSRAGNPDATLSRWVSGFEDDYSAYLQQNDFELEQDTRNFHFDEDTDAEGDEFEAEEEERRREAAGDRKSYVGSRKSYAEGRKSYIGSRKSYIGSRKSYIENRKSYVDARKSQGDRAGENAELEAASSIVSLSRRRTDKSTPSQRRRDPNMVSWEGPTDPENPKNWPSKRKWTTVLVVSSFTFISPVTSTMVAPALPTLKQDLDVSGDVLVQMMLSIFILAYAVGPLFLGPLSEMYGRVPVLQLASLFFLVFNTSCGFAQSSKQMLAFRFLSGLGGSAPLAIGGGVLADLFSPEQRGQAIAIHSLAPLIGPAVGPIVGGLITGSTTWRWVFWSISLADVVVQVSGIFLLRETWAPKLLDKKVKKLRKRTGNDQLYPAAATNETTLQKLEKSLVRPFRLMFTQPIIICAALYMAYLYGLIYLVISSFSALYTSPGYGQSVQAAGLHYIALAIGCLVGSQLTARFNQVIHRRQKARNNGKIFPEFRVPVLIPCAILVPIGFFWYGWSAHGTVFWVMPDIGAMILAGATMSGYQGMQSYIIDCYPTYAASAVASISTLRSMAGFGLPLCAPMLYQSLGQGWGNSLLAFIAIALGVPAPWFFWRYGARLRAKSQFAAG